MARIRRRQSGGREIWDVPVDGTEYRVVYDPHAKIIVTFLPKDSQI